MQDLLLLNEDALIQFPERGDAVPRFQREVLDGLVCEVVEVVQGFATTETIEVPDLSEGRSVPRRRRSEQRPERRLLCNRSKRLLCVRLSPRRDCCVPGLEPQDLFSFDGVFGKEPCAVALRRLPEAAQEGQELLVAQVPDIRHRGGSTLQGKSPLMQEIVEDIEPSREEDLLVVNSSPACFYSSHRIRDRPERTASRVAGQFHTFRSQAFEDRSVGEPLRTKARNALQHGSPRLSRHPVPALLDVGKPYSTTMLYRKALRLLSVRG